MNVIRVSTRSQLEDCFAIRNEVFVVEQEVPADLEIDELDASPEACHHLLIEWEGQPVAASRWHAYDAQTAKLQRVAVRKPFRGSGLGKMLITAMEQQAMELGYTASILDGQCHAEAFYERLGYVTISEEAFYDAGILHVRMKKVFK